MPDDKHEIYGIVLASGLSIRMGRQKLLLPLINKMLLQHVLDKVVKSNLKKVYTVVPENNNIYKRIVESSMSIPVFNRNPELGIGHSIAVAMVNIPESTDGVVFLLGDQPEIDICDINNSIELFKNNNINGNKDMIIRTEYRDGKVGHPVLFGKKFFNDLRKLEGDTGGIRIINANLGCVIYNKSKNIYPKDIDTREDYLELIRRQNMIS